MSIPSTSASVKYSGPERRRHPRVPLEVPVEILCPSLWHDEEPERLLGQTINLSEGGVCICIDTPIPESQVVLHLDYEGMGAEYVLVTIVREHISQSGWRYHCRIQRTLSHLDPMSVFT